MSKVRVDQLSPTDDSKTINVADIATQQDINDLVTELEGDIPFRYSSSPVAGMEAINSRANNRYRIGTFNTYVGYWNNFSTNGDNGYGINIKYIQEMILRYQLDFCGFQEFQSAPSYPISCLSIYPYVGAYFGKVTPISDHNGSSKFNSGNAITYNGSVASTSSAVYTAGATTDKRGYIRTVHSVRGISVAVYVTHLANTDAATRQAQMTELAAIVATDSASRVIVMGDFNTSTVSDFSAFTSIGFAMANNNDVNTSADGTWYIDNVLYKGFSSLVLKGAGTPYTYISDHKMFYAEFEV
ncbi:endonuclease/exonuclease/phosphatase family protein [Kluyvera ascorbata]|uniref:Endonuclease/exonuclease/phosphatase family protein n=1 Tax=Kluyvera ascorbata TaxID=51288 RepID=A0A3N2SDJ3_9ENTR|nr:endonuclease/exonuclease/phosphatase family protein [Kluyvera ascorbata]ROU17782.1 endonuclease/exonuclease/phosphatase family protein [Kluyvera ascorbata]